MSQAGFGCGDLRTAGNADVTTDYVWYDALDALPVREPVLVAWPRPSYIPTLPPSVTLTPSPNLDSLARK